MKNYSTQQLLDRWEDRHEVQNLMGRLSTSYVTKDEGFIYDRFWSNREDVCLGLNDGWYAGKAAVKGYYDALKDQNVIVSKLLRDFFPDVLGGKTDDEILGVGIMGYRPIDTGVIEVAGDGETAKGIWTCRGSYSYLTPGGTVANWEFSYFAVDFIKENGAWKIWHLLNVFDVDHPCGIGWATKPPEYDVQPKLAAINDFHIPKPTVPATLRELYHPMRTFVASPQPPKPYHTFAETFSYGMEAQ